MLKNFNCNYISFQQHFLLKNTHIFNLLESQNYLWLIYLILFNHPVCVTKLV